MGHYVKDLVDDRTEGMSDEEIVFFYRWKHDLERNEFVVNKGHESEIGAMDLLWQDYRDYDQLGHARLAFELWYGVLCHPGTISAVVRPGSEPYNDRYAGLNNRILSAISGKYRAECWSGGYDEDGVVYPQKGSLHEHLQYVPLEIGSVAPATLLIRLHAYRAFARWPYDSNFIYVFSPPRDPEGFNLGRLLASHLTECCACTVGEKSRMEMEARMFDPSI